MFRAFSYDLERVSVVILGQDPYHRMGQAHGLAFSVPPTVPPPPSLVNIFKELNEDVGFNHPGHGCLTAWAHQGVMLLNTTLTVQEGEAGSHQDKGWETFTDTVIRALSNHRGPKVFLLWGRHAQNKDWLIDDSWHSVLKASHPSPLSAHNGFFGCKHFSRANLALRRQGIAPINWQLPSNPHYIVERGPIEDNIADLLPT